MTDVLRTNSSACRSLANPRRVRLLLAQREAEQTRLDQASGELPADPAGLDGHPGQLQLELRFGSVGP